jgi:DNA polymerase-3 subunit alpha
MAALLSSQIGDTDSVVKYINETRELGIDVLPPDVNESGYRFTVVGDTRIRFGMGAIRNVGRGAIDSIRAARREKPFTSLFDLAERVDLRLCNRRVFEALINAGALDSLGGHRAQYHEALDTALHEALLQQTEVASGQQSLFGGLGDGAEAAVVRQPLALPTPKPYGETERLKLEKETLGFYISGHPLDPYRTECELFATHTVAQLGKWVPDPVKLGVVITAIKRQVSKRSNAEFARLTVEDFSGSSEVLVFPEAWAVLNDRVRPDVPVLLEGGYSKRDQGADNPTFIVETVKKLAELRTGGQIVVSIDLSPGAPLPPEVMTDVRAVVEAHPGSAPLETRWSDGNGTRVRFRSRSVAVSASNAALSELRALLGDRVRLVRGN